MIREVVLDFLATWSKTCSWILYYIAGILSKLFEKHVLKLQTFYKPIAYATDFILAYYWIEGWKAWSLKRSFGLVRMNSYVSQNLMINDLMIMQHMWSKTTGIISPDLKVFKTSQHHNAAHHYFFKSQV